MFFIIRKDSKMRMHYSDILLHILSTANVLVANSLTQMFSPLQLSLFTLDKPSVRKG